jgi:hypothetical protein
VRKDEEPGPTNARIDARNAIAGRFVRGMMVDDQRALMAKHQDLHEDNVHFNPQGSDIGGLEAADIIRRALKLQAN